jgi:hypothetical protein
MAGVILASFRAKFPEFSLISDTNIQSVLDSVNCGYLLIEQNVEDDCTLNIYYWLCAHISVTTYDINDGAVLPASPIYGLTSSTTSLVSNSFLNVGENSLEQSYMASTRYGQMFLVLCKQRYIHNTYGL